MYTSQQIIITQENIFFNYHFNFKQHSDDRYCKKLQAF